MSRLCFALIYYVSLSLFYCILALLSYVSFFFRCVCVCLYLVKILLLVHPVCVSAHVLPAQVILTHFSQFVAHV